MRDYIRNIQFAKYLPSEVCMNYRVPGEYSFFKKAFDDNTYTAEEVEDTDFVQDMKNGRLEIQDFCSNGIMTGYYYCKSADAFNKLLDRIDPREEVYLFHIVRAVRDGYEDYARAFLKDWRMTSVDDIEPTEGMKSYMKRLNEIIKEMCPIYAVVAILPSQYLWTWISRRLISSMHFNPGIYLSWFEACTEPNTSYALGNYITNWTKDRREFDYDVANSIYKEFMDFEFTLFTEAYHYVPPEVKAAKRRKIWGWGRP